MAPSRSVRDVIGNGLRPLAGGLVAGIVIGAVLEWVRLGSLPWVPGREVRLAPAVLAVWAWTSPETVRSLMFRGRPVEPGPLPAHRHRWIALFFGTAAGLLWWALPGTFFLVLAFSVGFNSVARSWPLEERTWLGRLIYAALAARLLFIFFYYPLASSLGWTAAWFALDVPGFHVPVLFGDGAEAILMSRAWALFWRGEWVSPGEVSEIFNPDRSVFSIHGDVRHLLPQSFLFFVFGVEPAGARVLSAVVSVLAGVVGYAALRDRFGVRAARWGAALLCFWPTLFLWSLDALKEPYFILAVVSSAYFGERFSRGEGRGWLAGSVATLVAALSIRTRWLPPIALTAALCLGGVVIQRALRRFALWQRIGCGLVALGLVASFAAAWAPGRRLVDYYVLESISAHRIFATGFGSGYKVWPAQYYSSIMTRLQKTFRWRDAAAAWANNLGHVLLEPFPRWWKGRKGIAYFLLAVPWWLALAMAFLGGWKIAIRRAGIGWAYLAYVAITLGFLAIFSGNVGTLIRHRDSASPVLLMIAAIGVPTLGWRVRFPRLTPFARKDSA
ncbi:MAG: ArnT family glycosyltransferase [Nitrospinota bacterium]